MKNFARRVAIVVSATAFTVSLLGAAAPAEAAKSISGNSSVRDSGWGS